MTDPSVAINEDSATPVPGADAPREAAAAMLFNEIATHAGCIVDQLFRVLGEVDDLDVPPAIADALRAIRAEADLVGYKADLGAELTGGDIARGGAAEWLLWPTTAEAVSGARVGGAA